MNEKINDNFIIKEIEELETKEVNINTIKSSCMVLKGANTPVQSVSCFSDIEDLN